MRLPQLLMLCGVTLFVIYPAAWSSHNIIAGHVYGSHVDGVIHWCKYWTLLALAALAEIIVLKKVKIFWNHFIN